MATTEHNSKHTSHNPFSHNTTNYADHHKHFHANTSAVPTGFHLPHHASTTPNLTTIKTNSSDSDNNNNNNNNNDQPNFPPQPPKPHHHHTLIHHHNNTNSEQHPSPQQPHHEGYITHHHRELSFGHDARHAKHDASSSHSASQQMPLYQPDRTIPHLTTAEEIALFKRQEAERRRLLEEHKEVDRKSWDEIVMKRERARRTSGAAYDVVETMDR